MRLGFLSGFIVMMWALLILGGFVLVKIVAPIELEAGILASSAAKAAIAVSMVAAWIWILILLNNAYLRRKLAAKSKQ
ncbi:MAG: hypothetical protein ACE5JV_01620 [Nitrososphaerales archaeon]